MEEIHNYPFNSVIKFKQPGRSFSYKVIKEGTYPNKESLAYTLPPNKYRIPDDYIIETTWSRSTNQYTVQCFINYNDNKPVFQVWYGKCFEYRVSSVKTATDAANLFHKHYTSQKGTKTSGIYLFGLQLKILDKARDRKRCAHVLKQIDQCSNSTLTRRATSTGKHMITKFNEEVPKFYNMEEIPVLENIRYSVKNHIFDVHYGENKARKKQKIESVVRALDEGNISREPYRRLCAIESHLPREGVVSKERQKINEKMAQLIPISIVDINTKNQVDQSEEEDIEDEDIVQEVINAAGKGSYRNIKDILQYLVPDLIQKRVLNPHHLIINLRISGDGRNVGKKIKHVMITVAILDDKNTLHKPNHHYTIVLYPGCENYDSLSHMMAPFCHDLRDLKDHGLVINNIRWNFQFYFSSDWKFLAICLGFNSANSKNFCPWCTISKPQQGNLSKEWTINKNINKLIEKNNYYEGHFRKPLFDMIPLDHWLPNELHVMLRITDRLWSLLIAELVEQNSFNDTARKIIIDEMKKIKVNFQFWQDQGSKTWNYTSLMGNDKLKVLQFFDLTKILSRRRAAIVRDLWDKFYELYIKMKDPTTNAEDFKNDAKNWLTLFLTPSEGIPNTREFKKGLYQPDNITPYIHVLVYHISEFMTIHHKWGLKAFSCSGIEKKNHEQVSYFFRKTMKDGGGKKNPNHQQLSKFCNMKIELSFIITIIFH
ncbi:hypothetical protein GLOIN_2v1478248 [Rhizophagus clarus]|uniref:Uncharacterized protein n=1 Tax=Rhizophagus clarus TaxID=94130 RepID=A0A8H3M7I5_9GLOM|nr:hypothetical protein GLOIN_2v1478248 [Rhizophagus clarus]